MISRFTGFALALVMAACTASAAEDVVSGVSTAAPQLGPTIDGAPTADLAGLFARQGLFDSPNLTTWRSYSFGMSMGGGRTTSGGLLVQHMQYQIAKQLTLHMAVGLEHDPLGMAGISAGGTQQANLTIPSLDLIYRPTESTVISFHYAQMSSGAGGFGAPWWEQSYDAFGRPRW